MSIQLIDKIKQKNDGNFFSLTPWTSNTTRKASSTP